MEGSRVMLGCPVKYTEIAEESRAVLGYLV
jgi:hypothetical protein